jgi:hypothetical protein
MTLAANILKMTYRELYPDRSPMGIKKTFRKLASDWHPDHNTDSLAPDVFQYIQEMRDRALQLDNTKTFVRKNGTSFNMTFVRETSGQGMRIFTGKSRIAYLITDKTQIANASRHKWEYASPNMRKEMEPYLRSPVRFEELQDGMMFIYDRGQEILMRDLIDLDNVPNEHVTWMISRMMNLACYLEWAKISHAALSPDTMLVSLENHTISIIGPVMFATPFGKRPSCVPSRTLNTNPWLKTKSEVSDGRIDLSLIRQTALDLFKLPESRLRQNNVKADIAKWISTPSPRSAIQDYEAWEKARGDRRFAIYPTDAQVIYDRA